MQYEDLSPFDCAKAHAFELQKMYPYFFENSLGLNETIELAKFLGIAVTEIIDTPIKGRLEITDYGSVIRFNPNLNNNHKINTILHEIGHWYLYKKYPEHNKAQLKEWKENYANRFAYEICVPSKLRQVLAKKLAEYKQVTHGIRLANKFNLPISVFLQIVSQEIIETEADSDNIWIIAKPIPNKYTNVDIRLRVHCSLFNRSKFFVPKNQSLENLVTDISWINNLGTYQERNKECNLKIQTRTVGSKPEYKKELISANCSAMRLNPNQYDKIPQVILLFNPK